jgi:hypothetical protein
MIFAFIRHFDIYVSLSRQELSPRRHIDYYFTSSLNIDMGHFLLRHAFGFSSSSPFFDLPDITPLSSVPIAAAFSQPPFLAVTPLLFSFRFDFRLADYHCHLISFIA